METAMVNGCMGISITSDDSNEMEEAAKKTPRATTNVLIENGTEQYTPSLVQRLQPHELQGRRIRLYRNGDRYFKGIWYTIIPSLRSWSAFLEDLQKIHFLIDSLALPHGVRFIFHINGEPCTGLEEIRHGQSYVVSSTDKFKSIDYANAAQPMWSFVSNKLSEPPKYGLRETFQREPNEFVKPRIITIIRNGVKPRRVVRHLLNKKTAQSYDMVIADITTIIKLNSGAVRKLYSISGKQVNTLSDFFQEDFIFIAYGTERICCDDFYVISEEYKRMEIGRQRPTNRTNGQSFRLRTNQMKLLRKRNQNGFQNECNLSPGISFVNGGADVELPVELRDKVRVMELLGDGNTALVYKAAFHVGDGKWSTDALKIVRRETLENREVLAFVQTEIELLGTLLHEHIVLLRDCQIHDGNWYIRMELVPDGDMFELLRRRKTFNETETASIVDCLCRALDYLHSDHLIVHRDVKLENLLVYSHSDGRLMTKLADFGLACRLQNDEELLYQLCGTPTYVAPEVLAEFGYSFKADCWSVGIILFILLCGFPPFGVDEPDEVLFNRILRGQFDFPSPSFDSISCSAKLAIARLLNTDPYSRHSASDVLNLQWIKTLGRCNEITEKEALVQLCITMTDMQMEDEPNDFAMSESSAEFFFSRRASMDDLSEPGTSSDFIPQHHSPPINELRLVEESREFAQRNIKIEQLNIESVGNGEQQRVIGKETPKVKRKRVPAVSGMNSARSEQERVAGIR